AAGSLIAAAPEWADRRIATAVGLSDKTISGLRPSRPTADDPQLDTPSKTKGGDGRRRPADEAARLAQREAIREALRADSTASANAIAEGLKVSVMTVTAVRKEEDAKAEVPPAGDTPSPM